MIPFACNPAAFQPHERARWRHLLDQLIAAVETARELPDGYALRVNTAAAPLTAVAEWVSLERKCCPFFDFEIKVQSADGATWLTLKGREGVKEFIKLELTGLL
jgi:hypothetical protein